MSPHATFSWNAAENTESYILQVSTSEDFENLVVDVMLEGTVYTLVEPIEPEATYYWRLRSTNNVGDSEWSETRSFITQTPPQLTVVANPNELASVSWTAIETAIEYEINVSTSPDFTDILHTITVTDGEQSTLPDMADGVYYVRVRAVFDDGAGDWSEVEIFEIKTVDGLDDDFASRFVAYPNPVTTKLQLAIPAEFTVNSLDLIDGVGRSVALPLSNEIDFTDRAAGMYYVKIGGSKGESITLKVMKTQ